MNCRTVPPGRGRQARGCNVACGRGLASRNRSSTQKQHGDSLGVSGEPVTPVRWYTYCTSSIGSRRVVSRVRIGFGFQVCATGGPVGVRSVGQACKIATVTRSGRAVPSVRWACCKCKSAILPVPRNPTLFQVHILSANISCSFLPACPIKPPLCKRNVNVNPLLQGS